ncbi:MAG TPA: alpha/beta hydrolase [Stellaceae bacterium]|nr:alpha/beta hydrolase [Stellaceae bacterium]
MMRAKTEERVKRWNDQRWVIDSVIQAIGMEWDQPRLAYTLYPCGPDAMGDFRGVGARVRKFADMHRELAAAARRREMRAEQFEGQGRLLSAGESYFIASLLWSAARWPIFENNEKSIHYNARTVACYDKYAKYASHPVERIEVPFGKGRSLPGYLHLPRAPKPGERFPCVVSVDGMDGSKEILCAMHGDKFLERGFANFIYDGPGQGECTISEIFVTPTNHMDAARAVYQRLAKHPHIDSERMVATGVSFGSYFGLQIAAALGDRLKGVAVSMVCHQPGAHAIMDMASPSFKMRFMYMAGFEDERKFDAFMRKFTLLPQAGKIKCPVLIQAGDDDELSPIEFSHALMDKIKAPKTFVVYEGERHSIGGGGAAQLGENWFTMLADWCLDRVNGKEAPNEHVFITALGQAKTTQYR